MKTALILLPVLLVAGFGAATKFVRVRHDLASQREAANQAWARVELALESRADLLPGLVDTMKSAGVVRAANFQEIAGARAALAGARSPQEKIRANDQLSAALGRLLVLSESYPRLPNNRDFQRIQDAISEKENDIAVERRKYNEMLEHYNTQIQMFPDNLVAGVSGFTRNDQYFPTEPGLHSVPKVP